MRAKEFTTEDINPDIYHQDFSHELEIDGIIYRAKTLKNDQQFVVRAYVQKPRGGEQCVGFAKFRLPRHEGLSLSSDWTKVATSYRGKGIASNMYAYARMLGNSITASSYQLDPGRRMWDKWREKGDAKHLSETDDDMFANRASTARLPEIVKDFTYNALKMLERPEEFLKQEMGLDVDELDDDEQNELINQCMAASESMTALAETFKNSGIVAGLLKLKDMSNNHENEVASTAATHALEEFHEVYDIDPQQYLSEDDDMFAPTKGIRIADALQRIATSQLAELRHNLEVVKDPVEKEWTRDQIADIPRLVTLANIFRTKPFEEAIKTAETASYALSIDFVDLLMYHDDIDLRDMFPGWEPDDN